ncbi:MAG: NusA N-terminal domain-containing protein [Planctomycetota bacterium]
MKSEEILRLVDTIHRSKEIEKEIVFQGIEAALLSAVRKKLGETETATVVIDRETGETTVTEDGKNIDAEDLGRLAAMSGKQVLFQKIREAERDRIFEDYEDKIGQLVSGSVQRYEGPNLIVSLGRVEGFLPRSEQARVNDFVSASGSKRW